MDALASRLGTRFLVVTVAPIIMLIGYLGFLLAAGAPTHNPSLARALKTLDKLTIRQGIVLVIAVLVISVALHPLQTPLIRMMEGYWHELPFGKVAAQRFITRFRDDLRLSNEAKGTRASRSRDPAVAQALKAAVQRGYWLPAHEADLLPTALGNTLRAGERRAGDRYGLEMQFALSRLMPLLSAASLADLRDRRNQLDAAARLCVAAGISTVTSLVLLIWHGSWLILPLATYLLCWACYRGAIAAAQGFSTSLAAAVDLHHLELFDAMHLERPKNLEEEYDLNTTLCIMFHDGLRYDDMSELRYK
jgi:hypothetical protein